MAGPTAAGLQPTGLPQPLLPRTAAWPRLRVQSKVEIALLLLLLLLHAALREVWDAHAPSFPGYSDVRLVMVDKEQDVAAAS